MDEEKILRDTETGEEFTYEEIEAEYERLKRDGETEAETIGDYIENITDPNGTCEWIDEIFHKCQWCGTLLPECELHEENDLGLLCEKCIMAIRSRGEPLTFKNRDKK